MVHVSPDHHTFAIAESDLSLYHACASFRPSVRIEHFSRCVDFSEILCWGILQKFVDIFLSWLKGDWKRGPALCVNPRHHVSATANKRKTPMG
jgi:hypothetical protein